MQLLFSTSHTVHAGPWYPSGSISRRLYPCLFFPASNTRFLHIVFSIVQPSLSWLSKGPFSFWDILFFFFPKFFLLALFPHVITIVILTFLISGIIYDSLYRSSKSWMIRILHTPFSYTGPNIFLVYRPSPYRWGDFMASTVELPDLYSEITWLNP